MISARLPARFALLGAALALLSLDPAALHAQTGPTESVSTIYGIVVDPASKGDKVLIATEYGLLRARPDGMSELVPSLDAAVVALTADPEDPRHLYASGVDGKGKPIGLMESPDGAATWSPVNRENPAALGSLAISRADPGLMVGLAKSVMISRDKGKTWQPTALTPEKTFTVVPSPTDTQTIFAGTMTGLMVTHDGGKSWANAGAGDKPTTMVATLADGTVLTFVFGTGLMQAKEPDLKWEILSDGFSDRYIVDIAQDPRRPENLFATMDTGAILTSRNSGKSWISFEGSDKATPERIARGEALFKKNCQACHGEKGIGEAPGDPGAKDEYGFKAPALNDDMHAWHHDDKGIMATISKGSPRNKRMVAFSKTLSDTDIEDLVTYIKSLWSIRSLACQGARHMKCM